MKNLGPALATGPTVYVVNAAYLVEQHPSLGDIDETGGAGLGANSLNFLVRPEWMLSTLKLGGSGLGASSLTLWSNTLLLPEYGSTGSKGLSDDDMSEVRDAGRRLSRIAALDGVDLRHRGNRNRIREARARRYRQWRQMVQQQRGDQWEQRRRDWQRRRYQRRW